MLDKGEVKKDMQHTEVVELENKADAKFLSVFGGHFQQLYFIVTAILEVCDCDLTDYYKRKQENPAEVTKPTSPAELLLE